MRSGRLDVLVERHEWNARVPAQADLSAAQAGVGRELYALFRARVGRADAGESIFT